MMEKNDCVLCGTLLEASEGSVEEEGSRQDSFQAAAWLLPAAFSPHYSENRKPT